MALLLAIMLFPTLHLTAEAQEGDRVTSNNDTDAPSPYWLTLEKSFTTLLSSTSDYKSSRLGGGVGITLRVPIYHQWGVRFSGEMLASSNQQLSPKEYLKGYALQVGADYMHSLWQGRFWLDGNLSLGYLSELRLSEGQQKRSESIPLVALGPSIRLGIGGTILITKHIAVQVSTGITSAPLSRPYSRATKKGLRGVDFGVGITYVIN